MHNIIIFQEKNNLDNFKTISEYYRRYKKLDLPTASTCQNGFGGQLKRKLNACVY